MQRINFLSGTFRSTNWYHHILPTGIYNIVVRLTHLYDYTFCVFFCFSSLFSVNSFAMKPDFHWNRAAKNSSSALWFFTRKRVCWIQTPTVLLFGNFSKTFILHIWLNQWPKAIRIIITTQQFSYWWTFHPIRLMLPSRILAETPFNIFNYNIFQRNVVSEPFRSFISSTRNWSIFR